MIPDKAEDMAQMAPDPKEKKRLEAERDAMAEVLVSRAVHESRERALSHDKELAAAAVKAAEPEPYVRWTEPREAERERLYWIMEELFEAAAEAHKVAAKCLRFGFDETQDGKEETNRERLQAELGDVFGVMSFMVKEGDLSMEALEAQRRRKLLKLRKFSRVNLKAHE